MFFFSTVLENNFACRAGGSVNLYRINLGQHTIFYFFLLFNSVSKNILVSFFFYRMLLQEEATLKIYLRPPTNSRVGTVTRLNPKSHISVASCWILKVINILYTFIDESNKSDCVTVFSLGFPSCLLIRIIYIFGVLCQVLLSRRL